MVGKLVFRLLAISRYVLPSAKAKISRARNTSPAGRVRDCAQRCKSSLCSGLSFSKHRLSDIPYWTVETCFRYRWDTLLEAGGVKLRRPRERESFRAAPGTK